MSRLHPGSLNGLAPEIVRPRYDRLALQGGIVHLGVGAFQRAHLGVFTEAAIEATGDRRWGIVGVSPRQPGTRDALAPQAGRYTLAVRDAESERIAEADTRIVSLTVTEKGYCHDPASGALRFDHPDVAHDLAHAEAPRSAVGFIVRGLPRRKARGLGPITLLSLDNLPANGHTLRGLVLSLAERAGGGLKAWIEAGCTFPGSMVDRIVPRTTDADRDRIDARLGVHDAWPVCAEPFLDWAVEDRFAAGRPAWEAGGARFVADAEPFERLKLRMVNGAHSALAYLGTMAGFATVDRAIAQPLLRSYIETLMREEIAPTLPTMAGPLAQLLARADVNSSERRRVEVITAFAPVFGGLGSELRFVEAVAHWTLSLREHGVLGTLARSG